MINSKKPHISIIMSIFTEPEKWLREAINSILNQSLNDFEFIIINDNPSRQLNNQLLKEYSSNDSRIKVISNETNIGLTKSLNKGLDIAKGEFVARMDADDISKENRFQKQYDFLKENPEYVACGTLASLIDENGSLKGTYKIPTEHEAIFNRFSYHNSVVHPSLIVRRSALTENEVTYNEKLRYAQDFDFVGRLLMIGKVANIPLELIKYRQSPNQVSSKKRRDQIKFADSVRVNFILQNKHLLPIVLKGNEFDSVKNKRRLLKAIEGFEYESSESFLKYVSLSLLTNFGAVNLRSMLIALLKKEYTLKDRLKVIRSFLNKQIKQGE